MAGLIEAIEAEIIEEIAEGIEVILSGGAFLMGIFPDSWVNDATLMVLDRTQPAGDFYRRALEGGGTLSIDDANQAQWNNIVDMIRADPGWLSALDGIKARVCADIRDQGCANGEITQDDIRDISISAAAPRLASHPGLSRSLNNVYTPYRWERIESETGHTFRVTVRVEDTWNFDKAHVWRDLQERGVLTPYPISIDMGNDGVFTVECPNCNGNGE